MLILNVFLNIFVNGRPECHNHNPCTYRIPLGLAPLEVVVTNKKIGTHALTVDRRTITLDVGYTIKMKKLDPENIGKQTFAIREGRRSGIVLDFEDHIHMKTLTLYTKYNELFVGSSNETIGSAPIYLKEIVSLPGKDDIIMFNLISEGKCLGLRPLSKINDPNQIYLPVFDICVEGSEDQLWAVFLIKLVKDRIDYDRHLITRRYFEERQHFLQVHEWPTLRLLLDKIHSIRLEQILGRRNGRYNN